MGNNRNRNSNHTSSNNSEFAVFDFDSDQERVEDEARTRLSKFVTGTPVSKRCNSPATKYKFLEYFARGANNHQKNCGSDPKSVNVSDDDTEERSKPKRKKDNEGRIFSSNAVQSLGADPSFSLKGILSFVRTPRDTSKEAVADLTNNHKIEKQSSPIGLSSERGSNASAAVSNSGSFEDVVYPRGDPDAVSICKSDIEQLHRDAFINDTIIDFYAKYLENKIKAEEKHRFHFFNSFFFRKLADLDGDPSRVPQGEIAFQRVRKWTRNVDLFRKDYLFIPVNFSLHWSLVVICHPGEVANVRDDEIKTLVKVPCILHMDSIRGYHNNLENLLRSYLWEEWKERNNEQVEDVATRFLNLRFFSLELPQQGNSYDCGLFLLHYLELFLENAPDNFTPSWTSGSTNFLQKDWFQPMEASNKRSLIRMLIHEIIEDGSHKQPPALHSNKSYSNNGDEAQTDVLIPQEVCSLSVTPIVSSPGKVGLRHKSSSLSSEELNNLVVSDSEDENEGCNFDDNREARLCQARDPASSYEDAVDTSNHTELSSGCKEDGNVWRTPLRLPEILLVDDSQ